MGSRAGLRPWNDPIDREIARASTTPAATPTQVWGCRTSEFQKGADLPDAVAFLNARSTNPGRGSIVGSCLNTSDRLGSSSTMAIVVFQGVYSRGHASTQQLS